MQRNESTNWKYACEQKDEFYGAFRLNLRWKAAPELNALLQHSSHSISIIIIRMDILFVHQLQSKWTGKKCYRQFALQSGDELFLKLVWNGANKMLLSAGALNVDIQDWRLKFYSSINAAIIGNRENFSVAFLQFSKLIFGSLQTYTFSFIWMEHLWKKHTLGVCNVYIT